MKVITYLALIYLVTISSLHAAPLALFSPHQGKQAFTKIYKMIETATEDVNISIYSWSDKNVDKSLLKALYNNVNVRIVLHPKLYKGNKEIQARVKRLELKGAHVKLANRQMHEKFVLVDNKKLVNTSANMSGGAQKRYSENFIFFNMSDNDPMVKTVINDFRHEFTLMWDSATDVITHNESAAPALFDFTKSENIPTKNAISLHSSSMNFNYKKTNNSNSNDKSGRYLMATKRLRNNKHIWTVRDMIIKSIRNAKSTVLVNMNHFFLPVIRKELIKAVKKGITVKMVVDNQEFKMGPTGKVETPKFVRDFKKLPGHANKMIPVRVKYYSHAPSPLYWKLNHHKYFIIDADLSADKTVLITGSYNLSVTAEHHQYDSMLLIKGSQNKELFKSYLNEFNHLWSLNRDQNDKPKNYLLKTYFKKNSRGEYPIHGNTPVSLQWEEVKKLRRDLEKVAPGVTRIPYNKSGCRFFHPIKRSFSNCQEL
ncbi:MAG: phosphatidylserine/phosphatidylglycerophosphate/cardiolipin synthase-like enzyme [Thermoproteota archaeon]|jgi:phosphatidylserine/phosphatidylglycerophosphate/cardiolipin synthase-like enzyme